MTPEEMKAEAESVTAQHGFYQNDAGLFCRRCEDEPQWPCLPLTQARNVLAMYEMLKEAREALRSLAREARGLLSVDRPTIVEAVGLTNVRCLERKIEDALPRLAPTPSAPRGEP